MHLSLELRKENSVRVTYTLKEVEIKIINHYSELYNLSKSKFVSNSIEHGFKFMEEELEDFRKNDDENLYENGKKYSSTLHMTFTLPKVVIDKLYYYSTKLKAKKSHLVGASIYLIHEAMQKDLDGSIEKLMKVPVVDDGYN